MQFLFNLLNHNATGQRSLEDVIGIFGHQLRALGHTAVWQTHNSNFLGANNGYNVIVEGFSENNIGVFAEAYAQGARFICLATEEPTEKGFNHGTQEEMIGRQKAFPMMGPFLDGILALVPGEATRSWYAKHAPTATIELGYSPTLVRKNTVVPTYDFGFYGSLTPRRKKLLKKIAARCKKDKAIRIVADFATQTERDLAMQDAKIILQVRKFDEMGLVSSSRCNTALSIGRPIIAEPHDLSKPWDEVIKFTSSEEAFISEALIQRDHWQGLHAAQFERFKKAFPPERCVGEPLRSIGVTEEMRKVS